jgi:flagellar hook-associated protein 1 FlgK
VGNATASQIQVFTREGRQIAGLPLTSSEVINYLTPENGFLEQAEYSAEYLNGGTDGNFQGSSIHRSSPTGAQTLRFSASGFTPPVWSGDTFPVSVPTQAQTIALSIGTEPSVQIDVPQGVMANYIAAEMNALSADLGVKAQAQTRLLLSAVPDGQISFSLKSENTEPIDFVGTVSNSDLRDLAVIINARSSETGVTANVSADYARLTLNNAEGYDIIVGDVSTAGNGIEAPPDWPGRSTAHDSASDTGRGWQHKQIRSVRWRNHPNHPKGILPHNRFWRQE